MTVTFWNPDTFWCPQRSHSEICHFGLNLIGRHLLAKFCKIFIGPRCRSPKKTGLIKVSLSWEHLFCSIVFNWVRFHTYACTCKHPLGGAKVPSAPFYFGCLLCLAMSDTIDVSDRTNSTVHMNTNSYVLFCVIHMSAHENSHWVMSSPPFYFGCLLCVSCNVGRD